MGFRLMCKQSRALEKTCEPAGYRFRAYLKHSAYKVVSQKSNPAPIPQLILYIGDSLSRSSSPGGLLGAAFELISHRFYLESF